MARPVMLGNGSLTVGLNPYGLVHDFYYPYVGLDNLTTARSVRHKIGIWVDGQFGWVDDDTWNISVDFSADALISDVTMQSDRLQVSLHFHDFVDTDNNAFCRQGEIKNEADHEREIRVFMHQVFQISRAGRADTALFVPEANYLLDYKGRCSLLIYGQWQDSQVFDQWAVGSYGIEGKEGTFRDAEDGELSGSAVEHGGVDSVLRLSRTFESNASQTFDYWIIAADSQYNAEKIHDLIKQESLNDRLKATEHAWHKWFESGMHNLHHLDEAFKDPVKKSLMVIKAHVDKRGGIIASCDSAIYNYGRDYYTYVWPRDGAYAIWPLIRLGFYDEPKRFFEFCRDILTHDGYLMHKYQPDRAIGSTWHPLLHGRRRELAIQEDETAIVLYMLGEYYDYSKDDDFVRNLYDTFIQPASNFIARFIDDQTNLPHASYDLWEEKFLTTTYTVAVTYRALLVASVFADKFEFPDDAVSWRHAADRIASGLEALFQADRKAFRKGFLLKEDGSYENDDTVDVSSMYGALMFGAEAFSDEWVMQTAQAIEATLLDQSPSGGSPRYEHDHYFESDSSKMGNPWFVTTLWMAQYYIRTNQTDKARHYIDWTLQHALHSGVLSEQINPNDGSPVSVTPLVWSHAELINTILDLDKIQ